jgi:hypothetical protein
MDLVMRLDWRLLCGVSSPGRYIVNGKRHFQNGRVTIWDIAHMSGVFISTISRILNDRPDVSDGTHEKVERNCYVS